MMTPNDPVAVLKNQPSAEALSSLTLVRISKIGRNKPETVRIISGKT